MMYLAIFMTFWVVMFIGNILSTYMGLLDYQTNWISKVKNFFVILISGLLGLWFSMYVSS